MNWNEENTKRLRELWAEGVMSAALIGNELGCSRCSVIGKARRLKLGPREPRLHAARRQGGPPRVRLKLPVLEEPPEVTSVKCEKVPPEGVHFFDLRWWHCRWLRDEDHMRYCGNVITRGSYCEKHAAMAYVAP